MTPLPPPASPFSVTVRDARRALAALTGVRPAETPLVRAPRHHGTAVFLHPDGHFAISALFANGSAFAWRTPQGPHPFPPPSA